MGGQLWLPPAVLDVPGANPPARTPIANAQDGRVIELFKQPALATLELFARRRPTQLAVAVGRMVVL